MNSLAAFADAPTPHREPPHNLEAEAALLGALLVQNKAFDEVADFLKPHHFADPVHGDIYEAIADQINAGRQATPATLKILFEEDERLSEVGGIQYLVKLAASVVTIINAKDYGLTILDMAKRRRLIEDCERAVADAYDLSSADDAATNLQKAIDDLAGMTDRKGDLQQVAGALDSALETAEAAMRDGPEAGGVSTGIVDMDRAMGVMGAGRLYIGGGRPGMGKSAIAIRIARNAAFAGKPIAVFSLEMPKDEIAARLLAMESGISQERQELGELSGGDFQALFDARERLKALPLHIDDTPASTVHEIRRRAIRMRRRHGLGLLVIDYLQLIAPGNSRTNRQTNRVNDLTEITAALKALAKELGVPVLALSQLSRAVEQREDKRPMLSDLRESGSIEQDADVVFFPYRHEYYLDRTTLERRPGEGEAAYFEREADHEAAVAEHRNRMEILVAKRRGGRAGHAKLFCNMETGVITDGAREE
jgi:replicative DNA helicase